MAKEHAASEEQVMKKRRLEKSEPSKRHAADAGPEASGLAGLQRLVGNRAVQRLLAQRSGSGSFELNDDTAERISHERGGGQPLDSGVQEQMSDRMGQDFSGVRVHTSSESSDLSRQLGAKAFTTGQDVFFREGAYDPHTSSGQELIGHELVHVVQQGSGAVSGGGRMKVNAPGDAFEQQADAVSKAVTGPGSEPSLQRQAPEEEEAVQTQEEEEEVQAQEEEEGEEVVQAQEEEDEVQPQEEEDEVQPQEEEEGEEVVQAQEEEEEVQLQEEEEEVQAQEEEEEVQPQEEEDEVQPQEEEEEMEEAV